MSPANDVFVRPRLGHMHNFASMRELFREQIHPWAAWVGAARNANLRLRRQ